MKDIKIVVIDDEADYIDSISDFLEEYSPTCFTDPKLALKAFDKETFDIIISDYKMPGLTGVELLIQAKQKGAYKYGILFTAFADKQVLETVINKDLVNMLVEKPIVFKELKKELDKAVGYCREIKNKEKETDFYKEHYRDIIKDQEYTRNRVIGYDRGLQKVFKQISQVAAHNVNILITGETGTGKELISHEVHSLSNRKEAPLIQLNCGAIPENLIESELFGHVKGAFTDAKTDRVGKFELAMGGTLFLDEIGELKMDLQTKLLRVLEEKKISRIGSNTQMDIDFRLICATNRDLAEEIRQNNFRDDLFYRISGFPIHIPPLRERKEDIEELIAYFTGKFSREFHIDIPAISREALLLFQEYSWPGNVREMENVVRRILLTKNSNIIEKEDLSFLFLKKQEQSYTYEDAVSTITAEFFDRKITMKEVQVDILKNIVKESDGSISKAVGKTGISKDMFYRNLPSD